MTVLGIETSCDETAAAVIRLQADRPAEPPRGEILSNMVFSQIEEHEPFGGVVPEIAARSHVTRLDGLVEEALKAARISLPDLDGIAATAGPGLIGGVMVGLVTGKALALACGKPLIAVNHLEAHLLTIRLTRPEPDMTFPYLLLLVSGGHCQLVNVRGLGDYEVYGSTLDDAAGEAFDKAAKLLGLGYPGGPEIEKWGTKGDAAAIDLPRPLRHDGSCNFSFSGLKTALRTRAQSMEPVSQADIANLSASFQAAITDCLAERCQNAMRRFDTDHPGAVKKLVVAGGVAANSYIRDRLAAVSQEMGFALACAPAHLCTDNAAMIAWAGAERLLRGQNDGLGTAPRARWPLDDVSAPDSSEHA
ncbi:MAG: tRNA (adenosine(37)-N6)-threonylcarbamoyltransferase complex transferase subunit TsaD [Parvibaculales bacterium]